MSVAIAVPSSERLPALQWLRALRYALSGLLLSALSARAAAPAPSQEFWSYLVEFGDAQGELFDPADYAVVAAMPEKARADFERAEQSKSSSTETTKYSTETVPAQVSHANAAHAGQEQSQ